MVTRRRGEASQLVARDLSRAISVICSTMYVLFIPTSTRTAADRRRTNEELRHEPRLHQLESQEIHAMVTRSRADAGHSRRHALRRLGAVHADPAGHAEPRGRGLRATVRAIFLGSAAPRRGLRRLRLLGRRTSTACGLGLDLGRTAQHRLRGSSTRSGSCRDAEQQPSSASTGQDREIPRSATTTRSVARRSRCARSFRSRPRSASSSARSRTRRGCARSATG